MIVFSLFSLVISFVIFIVVQQVVYSFGPSNPLFANILVILIGSAVVSLFFTYRQFRHMGKDKWRNPIFHQVLLRTFLINFTIIFIISWVI